MTLDTPFFITKNGRWIIFFDWRGYEQVFDSCPSFRQENYRYQSLTRFAPNAIIRKPHASQNVSDKTHNWNGNDWSKRLKLFVGCKGYNMSRATAKHAIKKVRYNYVNFLFFQIMVKNKCFSRDNMKNGFEQNWNFLTQYCNWHHGLKVLMFEISNKISAENSNVIVRCRLYQCLLHMCWKFRHTFHCMMRCHFWSLIRWM